MNPFITIALGQIACWLIGGITIYLIMRKRKD